MTTKPRLTPLHLLLLLYLSALLLVVSLLIAEEFSASKPFILTAASLAIDPEHSVLSVRGENFSSGLKGLLTKNLLNEKALLWQTMADTKVRGVDTSGNLALVSCYSNKLVSIGSTDAVQSELLGSLDLPDEINLIRIVDGRALVALKRNSGMVLVDLHDPAKLKLIDHYPVSGLITNLVVAGKTVFYANLSEGIGRIDLSAKHPVPELLTTVESPWGMAMLGARMVTGSLNGQLRLFNLAADGVPKEVGQLTLDSNIRDVALIEDALIVALADGTTYFYSLETWPKLGKAAMLKMPGRPFRLQRIPGKAAVAVSLVAGGVAVVDVRQTEKPQISGELKIPSTFLGMKVTHQEIWAGTLAGLQVFALDELEHGELAVQAPQALVSDSFYTLYSWNGRVYGYNQKELVEFGASAAAGHADGNRLLAVADGNEVVLFAGEPGRVQRAGTLEFKNVVVDTIYHAGTLYVLNRRSLQIFTGDAPGAMQVAATLPLPGLCRQMARLDSGHLLVSTIRNGLLVVDVSKPQVPEKVASLVPAPHLTSTDIGNDILLVDNLAFISEWAGGVYVVDLGDPTRPRLRQMINTPGFAAGMAVYDDLLLVADKLAGVFMIDIRDHEHAVPVGAWPMPLSAKQIAVTTDGLIASNDQGGTIKLPLPQRLPQLDLSNRTELKAETTVEAEPGLYLYLYEDGESAKVRVVTK